MLKYVASFLIALFIANPIFAAELPCGQIKSNKAALVTIRLNPTDAPGSVTTIKILLSNTSGGPSSGFQAFALPAPNEDGSYTVRISSLQNNKNHYFAASVSGPFGESPRSIESPTFIPAEISGVCPPPGAPDLLSVVPQ